MEEWTMEQFQEEVRRVIEESKKIILTQDQWDSRMRSANISQWKQAYHSDDERIQFRLTYKKEVDFENERFTYFWATKSPFSQWHKCSFKAFFRNVDEPLNKSDNDEHIFSSAEQYMMYAKAMLFLDRDSAKEILQTKDVRKIKELGRKVKFFDEPTWDFNKFDIVYLGNKQKFFQNEDLKQVLLETKGTTLVEAAPNDKIWGIGLTEDDVMAKRRKTWQGKNLLGEILTQLRFELLERY